jgi:hypothetical protein
MGNERDYSPDGQWRDMGVEVKRVTHGFRNLRASLLGLAYWLADRPENRALLLLLDSRITEKRLQHERELASRVIRPEIMRRLIIASGGGGRYVGLPQDLGDDFGMWLNQIVSKESPKCKSRDSYYVILQILLHEWLLGKAPLTRKALGSMTGCSYPTLATALNRLGPYLGQSSSRGVELTHFPGNEWERMLAVSDRIRETKRFAVASGEARSPEAHLRRLAQMGAENVAIGGVLGARHYYPDLDLVGTPRLDLSLHCPGKRADLELIRKLDPALRPVEGALDAADVVVHTVRRAETFFVPREGGLKWADPVECLMDLHEAHLELQAKEFLAALETQRARRL